MNGSNEEEEGQDKNARLMQRITMYLNLYYSPTVMLIGLAGNSILIGFFIGNMRVRISRNLRALYLLIALFDNGPLLFYHGCIAFIGQNGWAIDTWWPVCKLLYSVLFFTEGASNGLVAFLAVERFINIFHPFDVRLRYQRSQWLIVLLVLLSMLINLPVALVYDVVAGRCLPQNSKLHKVLLFSANLFNLPLPSCTMIVCNALCVLRLWRRRERTSRKRWLVVSQFRSLTVLFWLSGTFLVFVIPCSVAHVLCELGGNELHCRTLQVIYSLSGSMHAVNFFVYVFHMRCLRMHVLRCCDCPGVANTERPRRRETNDWNAYYSAASSV